MQIPLRTQVRMKLLLALFACAEIAAVRADDTGKTMTWSLRDEFLTRRGPFADHPVTFELLERPDAELKARIAARTELMLTQGIIEEAEHLLAMGLDPELTSSRAVGYRAVMDWLEGGKRVARSGLAERINLDTWALVRKQRKWFRRLGLAKDSE